MKLFLLFLIPLCILTGCTSGTQNQAPKKLVPDVVEKTSGPNLTGETISRPVQ